METSIFLAKVIGLVSVISVLAVFAQFKTFQKSEEEAARSAVFVYVSGFLILILGVLLVVSHNVWVSDWRVVITIVSWLVLLKGLGRLFFPQAVRQLIERKKNNRWFLLGEVAMLAVGLYLLYYGFLV